jgi:hypothetical protein
LDRDADLDGIPEEASYVRVEVYNADSDLVTRKNYTVSSGALVIENLDGANFPATGRPTIKAYALDADRNVIGTVLQTVDPLDAGANAISMNFGGYRWRVSTSTVSDPHVADSTITMSEGSTLEVYRNGALVKIVTNGLHKTMNSRVEVYADAGDTLRLIFCCNWTLPYTHYRQYIHELWLTRTDDAVSDKVKLAVYSDFGWNDDKLPNLEGFDLAFTFPDFG